MNRGNYEAKMSLDKGAKADLQWWVYNAHKVCLRINKGRYHLTLSSDASGHGWGITDGTTEGMGDGMKMKLLMQRVMK